MWDKEKVFSKGELSGTMEAEYEQFIEEEYEGDYHERLEHIEHLIDRLQFEKKKLKEKISES